MALLAGTGTVAVVGVVVVVAVAVAAVVESNPNWDCEIREAEREC